MTTENPSPAEPSALPAQGPLAAIVRKTEAEPAPAGSQPPASSAAEQAPLDAPQSTAPQTEAPQGAPGQLGAPGKKKFDKNRRRGPRRNEEAREGEAGQEGDNFEPPPFIKPPKPELGRRGRLSADAEAEINAALGEISLDAISESSAGPSRLENDSRHRATVLGLNGDDVFFSLGGKAQGVASVRMLPKAPEVGEVLDVIVAGYDAENELYSVRVPGGAVVTGDWSDISEGSMVEARVSGANTGGLEVMVNNIRGFIPISQIAPYRVENTGEFIGQKFVCVVTEANAQRGNLVLSRRAVLEREKEEVRKRLLTELQPGEMREGTIRKILDFGAFCDIGGIDGLIPIGQMSWDRIAHPSEIVQEGQKVRVRIERIDQESGKISLSLKNPEEHPWADIEQKFPVGSTQRGPVSRIAQFGAFVKLAPGIEGLIHISELAHHKVYAVSNVVKEGQEVEVKILSIDPEAQRIGLSLKATLEKPKKAEKKEGEVAEVEEPKRELAVAPRKGPLKGGAGKGTGGEQFGLKW
jgi:small subunit ribosomal protein S1